MEDISSFRGMAGEVVKSFIRPNIFLTVIPILFFWIFVIIAVFYVGSVLPIYLQGFILLASSSFLLGRFAMPASRGELDAGFFGETLEKGDVVAYMARYTVLTILWLVPVTIIGMIMAKSFSQNLFFSLSMGGMSNIVSAGFQGVLAILLLLIVLAAPTLCAILATYSENLQEVFSLEIWIWLLQDRRADLICYYANLLGGVCIFWSVYLIPLILFAIIAFKISTGLGMTVASFIYLLPVLISPVLIGRLSGAFVVGEEDMVLEDRSNVIEQFAATHTKQNNTSTDTSHYNDSKFVEEMKNLIAQFKCLNPIQLEKRIEQLSEEVNKDNNNLPPMVELLYIYQHLKQEDKIELMLQVIIQKALTQKENKLAALLFYDFNKHKTVIHLSAEEWNQLSAALSKDKYFLAASWCLQQYIVATDGQNDLQSQKNFVALADQASRSGKHKEAFVIYAYFYKHFPESTLRDYALSCMKREKSKD